MARPPTPLSATPTADIQWRDGSTPISNQFDDIYFSVDGGLEETVNVFLTGCHLPHDWQNQDIYTICELGFGTGLNFLATLDLWQHHPGAGRLHFVSIEAYPLDKESLKRALDAWPELAPLAKQLLEDWPGRVRGLHRIHFGTVSLTLMHMDVLSALQNMNGDVDAWFLDGFSPAKNQEMWSDEVLTALAAHSVQGTKLASFTVAGKVRRGLERAGFSVQKRQGFGRKRERLEAIYQGGHSRRHQQRPDTPIIIGSGIAGASIARAYQMRGITPVLIDPDQHLETAASGNPAAIVMPRLDLQDRPESRFFLNAYLYARHTYLNTNTVLQTGLIQIAGDEKEALRFTKIAHQAALPPSHMQLLPSQNIGGLSGLDIETPFDAIYFPQAMTIAPKPTIKAWTEKCHRLHSKVGRIDKTDTDWRVWDENGQEIAKASTVHICAGQGVEALVNVDVRYTSGQICWHDTVPAPQTLLTYGGYAAKLGDGILLGATHNHVSKDFQAVELKEETLKNIREYERISRQNLTHSGWKGRASVRVTTRDTLPVSYEMNSGLWVMAGLGSRGFVLAPLLAEAQISHIFA
ncbi:MAG TPA: FAD-dependent oxidoreductase, partial [Hellea balneolensis]|nr:FAD-dependent oxidoreductase [Hellea balneolensis]